MVQPRTLQSVSDEVAVNFISDEQQLSFEIHINKSQTYVFKSQENDNEFENEHIRLYIAPTTDTRAVYVFGVNHQRAYFDGIYAEQSGLSTDWNGQWDYEVETGDDYWKVTGTIGWKNFLFNNIEDTQTIRVGIAKHDNNGQRILSSVPSYIGYTGFVQALQTIDIKVANQSKFEIFPYYSLNHSLLDSKNSHNVGGELFWQANQNLSVDLSVNPDFGQVESNELVVNFSAIEVFFSEQRPFFTRNQSLFDVAGPEHLRLVHTPRIGGSSALEDIDAREVAAAARLNYVSEKLAHSILFASENDADEGQGRDFIAARSTYASNVGIWGVSANIVDTPSIDRHSRVFGLDYFTNSSDSFDISAGIVASFIDASKDTQDIGIWAEGSIELDDKHLHDITAFIYGDQLEVNDIGFVQRVDRKQVEYEYTYLLPLVPISFIEQMSFGAELELKTNFKKEKLPAQIGFVTEFVTTDDASYEVGLEFLTAGKDDILTRNFNATTLDRNWAIETLYESPEFTFGQIEIELEYGTENWSGQFYEAAIAWETEVFSNLFSEIAISQYHSKSWLNWEGENEVSEFDFIETGIDIRLNYRFSDQQEIRLRLELVAGKALGKTGNNIANDGGRVSLEVPDDFVFSESALQLRYKYSISQLSAIFVSYTFGGEFEVNNPDISRRGLYDKAISQKNSHGLFLKTRLQF